MRTIPILTIAAILIASTATAYYLLRDHEWTKRAEEAKPAIGSASPLDGPDTPVRDGRRDQPAHPEQPLLTRLQEQVAALEARLRHMEAAVREPSPRQAGSRPDEPASHHDAETARARKWSDADFTQWMDAALDAGDFDRDATESVMEQAATSLTELPGINLTDLQCGAQFCRATLIPETGEQLDLAELVGASPFMGSALSVPEPDGSVRVYFVQAGQSFSELQDEAQTTAR
jgi:hypothetical protein